MSSRTGNWMIAVGAFGMFIGLCLVPAAMGPNPDSSVLALAACVFSFGALITASGMYLKARGLQSAAASAPENKNATPSLSRLPGPALRFSFLRLRPQHPAHDGQNNG